METSDRVQFELTTKEKNCPFPVWKKTDFKENKSEETKKKNKKVKSKLNEKQELKSSDSKEYVEEEEEEEEESNEIGDSDSNEDDISKSQLGHNKKRKLDDENQGPGWSRKWRF